MAGHYARIYRAIWDDDDFLALTPPARLLYIAVFSHKKVNAVGVVDHRPARWQTSTGLDPDDIAAAIDELTHKRFIAVDHDTAEIAIRTYVRHDISAGQPNMAVAVWNAWSTIESRRLGRWILDEIPADMWDATHRGGKTKGQSAVPPAALALRHTPFEPPSEPPSKRPFEPPSEPPSKRPFEPPSEPPTPTPTPSTYAQQPTAVPTAVPASQPVPPGPAATAAAAPVVGQPARATVLAAAVQEVARRRDTNTRSTLARNPAAWLTTALTGIERELLEHQAYELIHQGATAQQVADLIQPERDPDIAPIARLDDRRHRDTRRTDGTCTTCLGTGWDPDPDLPEARPCPTCTAANQEPEPA